MLPERIDRVRDLAAGWVRDGHTPALVVLVARRGAIVLHEAFGKLRPDEGSPPLTLDSIYPLASVSKPITAGTVMTLVEDGLLGLNRPVVDYLPELKGVGAEEILVHHLLSHTSGYNDEELGEYVNKQVMQNTDPTDIARFTELVGDEQYAFLNEFIERSLGPVPLTQHPIIHSGLIYQWEAPLTTPPGTEMAYANQNYTLLAEIMRRITGRALDDLVRERIFAPLGMCDSWFAVPESVRSRLVRRPVGSVGEAGMGFIQGMNSRMQEEVPEAGGGLYSTALDLARFGQAFLNGGSYGGARILSRASVEEMTRNHNQGIGTRVRGHFIKEAPYGYGWFISTNKWRYLSGSLQASGAFEHAGHGGASLWVDRQREIVGVYLEVCLRETADMEPFWNYDLFQNAVTSAVDD